MHSFIKKLKFKKPPQFSIRRLQKIGLSLFIVSIIFLLPQLNALASIGEDPNFVSDGENIVHYLFLENTDFDISSITSDSDTSALSDSDTSSSIDSESTVSDSESKDSDSEVIVSDSEMPDTNTETDTNTTSTDNYENATYRVIKEYAEIYRQADITSAVLEKAPRDTLHIVKSFEGDFGYITYKGVSGYIQMKEVKRTYNPIGESLVEYVNSTVETLLSQKSLESDIACYSDVKDALSETFRLLESESSVESIRKSIESLDEDTQTLNKAAQFIKDPEHNFPSEFRYYGDVNGDTKVNLVDVVYIQRYIAQLLKFNRVEITASDVTADSLTNMFDIVAMQQFAANLREKFSAGLIFHITTDMQT